MKAISHYLEQWHAEGKGGGETGRRPRAFKVGVHQKSEIKKLHFIKLLKIYAVSYRKFTNTCCMDLIESCLGASVFMFSRKSSAISAFVLKLLFIKFQLVCYVLYKKQTYNYLSLCHTPSSKRKCSSSNPKHALVHNIFKVEIDKRYRNA